MCIHLGHMCICVQDMKILWSNLWLGELSTDDDANDNDNDVTWRTLYDYTGSLAFLPNEAETLNGIILNVYPCAEMFRVNYWHVYLTL